MRVWGGPREGPTPRRSGSESTRPSRHIDLSHYKRWKALDKVILRLMAPVSTAISGHFAASGCRSTISRVMPYGRSAATNNNRAAALAWDCAIFPTARNTQNMYIQKSRETTPRNILALASEPEGLRHPMALLTRCIVKTPRDDASCPWIELEEPALERFGRLHLVTRDVPSWADEDSAFRARKSFDHHHQPISALTSTSRAIIAKHVGHTRAVG
ncbi:hypothetical protein HBH92_153260 [Parastagonospora nodorum]|nr:hypothetical protein HBH92_153260 [Parastagonospora nodorum]KAH5764723.1 hypothetical protein HBI17_044000 [Parastagonospora nodorum]